MLADERDLVIIVDGDHADRAVVEVDHTVDAGLAVGPRNVVVPDVDPGVLIADATAPSGPRADRGLAPARFLR
jgi:hypothetical protein